jgi:hypothetical protein
MIGVEDSMADLITETFDDYEFIFLGGFVRSHQLKQGVDTASQSDDMFVLVYPERNQVITILRRNLLQWSVTETKVTRDPSQKSAVEKAVEAIKLQEAARQGVTVKVAPSPQK